MTDNTDMADDRTDDGRYISRSRALELLGLTGAALPIEVLGASPSFAKEGDDHDAHPFHTPLTATYDLRYPFVGAGMGFVAMPELVAAVTNAGGLGVLGNAIEPPPATQVLIRRIRQLTGGPFGVDFCVVESAFGTATVEAHIDVAIAEQVPLVVFHFDVPPQEWVSRLQGAGTHVWSQVPSLDQAKKALARGVDGIVAQGSEAGGHTRSVTPLYDLLEQVRGETDKLVLAAGGISTGKDAARAMGRGADGVWVGTRLIASDEAYAHPEYKRRLLRARRDQTVLTTMFGPELPNEPFRALCNDVVSEWAGREDEIPVPPPPPAIIGSTVLFPQTLKVPYDMPKFSAVAPTPETTGDFEEMALAAGAGVHSIHRIMPAGDIVHEMMGQARVRLLDILE